MRCLVYVVVLLAACAAAAQVSPFEDVEWGDGGDGGEGAGEVRVFVRGEWYEPVAIEGTPFAALVAFAEQHYADRAWAQKRLDEDLLDVFEAFGAPPLPERVSLTLRPVVGGEGGEVVTLRDVLMTEENRERLRNKRAIPWDRARAARLMAEFGGDRLHAARAQAIIAGLEWRLAERHSYSAVGAAPPGPALDGAPAPETVTEIVRRVRARLAATGDGHARVRGRMVDAAETLALRGGALPIAAIPLDLAARGRVVATLPGGAGLVDPERPFLVAIDGVELERWLDVAVEVAPGGSVASRRHWACRELSNLTWLRERLGLEATGRVSLRVADAAGNARDIELELAEAPARAWRPRADPGRQDPDDDIAYVAIEAMWGADDLDGVPLRRVQEALERARAAPAVIIDIRGNTGGTRDALHLVASYLMAPDQAPVVYSAARARMWPGRDAARVTGQFAGRRLFPPGSERWSEAEEQAIGAFLDQFEPEAPLDDEFFGPLMVSVLSPGGPGGGALAGKPVIVLMDELCISASDIFLCGVSRLPNVTLVGRPSRGASGMSQDFELDEALSVKLSTMISFMPDGRLFDWHGVAPDVPVELTPGDFCRGGADTALEVAVKLALGQIGAGQAPPR